MSVISPEQGGEAPSWAATLQMVLWGTRQCRALSACGCPLSGGGGPRLAGDFTEAGAQLTDTAAALCFYALTARPCVSGVEQTQST